MAREAPVYHRMVWTDQMVEPESTVIRNGEATPARLVAWPCGTDRPARYGWQVPYEVLDGTN